MAILTPMAQVVLPNEVFDEPEAPLRRLPDLIVLHPSDGRLVEVILLEQYRRGEEWAERAVKRVWILCLKTVAAAQPLCVPAVT